ncbi:MAG: DUF1614 domain-containing protein [ANME-2 cluster archaeon]|nr:DUF1614 domain-containing protein [ANME-2 cluster archaeon]MDF1556987.1 DUF1614 domain-containing protein [ANME-2 cluster archaeon]
MRGKIFRQDVQMFALFGFILLAIFYLIYTEKLGIHWNIHPIILILTLAGMLVFSAAEIPIYRMRTKKPDFSDEQTQLLGEFYSVPLEEECDTGDELVFNTKITLNVGGFILPLLFSVYAVMNNPGFAALEIMLIVVVFTHLLSDIKPGIGIVIPDYMGLLPIPFALILDPGNAATVVLVSGVLGILLGVVTTLFNINEQTKGSAYINLGGVGNFRAIYITVLLAVLLSFSSL